VCTPLRAMKSTSNQTFEETFLCGITYTVMPEPGGGGAQCVELALRWQFCGHGSICHEIYF
jgi:hypothetical protein